mgnify:CR=1 FL=1
MKKTNTPKAKTLEIKFIKIIKSISKAQNIALKIQQQADNIPAEVTLPNDNGMFASCAASMPYMVYEYLTRAMETIDNNLKHHTEIKDILDNDVTVLISNASDLAKALYLLVKNFYSQVNILKNETSITELLSCTKNLYDVELAEIFKV